MQEFVIWWNTQPWSIAMSEWIRDSGFPPSTLGYLISLVILGLIGVFRERK